MAVIGAAGQVGSTLVHHFHNQGVNVVAAVRNREGELGLGLDATIQGAQACLASLGLGAIGVPLWVFAELRLRRKDRVIPSEEPIESL